MKLPKEARRILLKEPHLRTEEEIAYVIVSCCILFDNNVLRFAQSKSVITSKATSVVYLKH